MGQTQPLGPSGGMTDQTQPLGHSGGVTDQTQPLGPSGGVTRVHVRRGSAVSGLTPCFVPLTGQGPTQPSPGDWPCHGMEISYCGPPGTAKALIFEILVSIFGFGIKCTHAIDSFSLVHLLTSLPCRKPSCLAVHSAVASRGLLRPANSRPHMGRGMQPPR